LYIKLETGYNNKMKECTICKKQWDPKCKWMPCKLTKLYENTKEKK